ncbi:hypothetical protein AMECASPLE_027442 [Ameca splendens]|uniref:Uncharacterized protein n=1 Tax=Ameca splendens TaxID=208324 RepID=A0ABV0Y523_9TELE
MRGEKGESAAAGRRLFWLRSPEPVNLVEGHCSPVSYIAWDSTGAGGLPTHQHRRKTEGGGGNRGDE